MTCLPIPLPPKRPVKGRVEFLGDAHRTHACAVSLNDREHPPVSENKRWQWHILLARVMRPTHLFLGCFSSLHAPHSTDHVSHIGFEAWSLEHRMYVCVLDRRPRQNGLDRPQLRRSCVHISMSRAQLLHAFLRLQDAGTFTVRNVT